MSACSVWITEKMETDIRGKILTDVRLDKYTSWRVGGPADQIFFPADRDDLIRFLQLLPDNEPVFWVGMGSNLLVRDGGIRGTVINTRGRLKKMTVVDQNVVVIEAGVKCPMVARFCSDQGFTGAEFLAGIPGSMGGALKMNAGAFGGETWEIVENVEMVDAAGNITTRHREDFEIGYRSVQGRGEEWFLQARLRLQKGDSVSSQEQIKALLAKRAKNQPTNQATCGSVFKNPEHDFAARLIEASDLKGFCIGGACVSEKHANFIVNTGQATAADIEALIEHIRNEVSRLHGVTLKTEVCVVGEKETA